MNTQPLAFQSGTTLEYHDSSSTYRAWYSSLEYDDRTTALIRLALYEYLKSSTIQSYKDRISKLEEYVEEEEDGMPIREASRNDFWEFVCSIPSVTRGGLFLMENGNLRATWNNASRDHVGLEFLGDQRVMYVVFKYREDGTVDREADYIAIDDIIPKLQKFGLDYLLYDGG